MYVFFVNGIRATTFKAGFAICLGFVDEFFMLISKAGFATCLGFADESLHFVSGLRVPSRTRDRVRS